MEENEKLIQKKFFFYFVHFISQPQNGIGPI